MNKLLVTLFCLVFGNLTAQEAMEVQRCANIDRLVPISNIFVDGSNNKWVADAQGLFLAQSPEFAKTVDIPSDKWSVLSAPDGNIELNLDKAKLEGFMGDNFNSITCAHIDPSRKELWIGTNGGGLFQFNVNPGLNMVNNLTSGNSKLRSNKISTLYIDPVGKLYAGTDDGLFSRKGGKESLYSKGFDVTAIANYNGNLWVIADGEVLEVDKKGDFYEMEIDERKTEGELVDIAFDSDGRLWIASEVVTRYNLETEYYDFFGPAEEFTSQDVMCITIDGDDALWVGTKDKGVYFIGRASSLTAAVVIKDLLACEANAKDASIQVRASGGQPPYSYKWDNGLKGENPKGLGPGTYAVTVTDKNGNTTKANKTINDPRLEVSVSMTKEASLGGGKDGHAEVKVTGGNNKFSFLWDNGETKQKATKLTGGEHVVTITDKGSCSTTATVTITEKLAPLSVNIEETTAISCHTDATAVLTANAAGGQGPYQYSWSKGGRNETNSGLAAGSYQITVTDSKGGTANASITISQPSKLTVSAKVKSPASTNNADGKATAKGAGGTGKYTYKWDTGEAGDVATKLAAGSHVVTVTDEKGCTATMSFDITENILTLSVDLESTSKIKCTGESSGALKADISGGKPPFTYKWSNNATSETINGLAAGEYQLVITDAAGTTTSAKTTVKEPGQLSVSTKIKSPASTNNSDGKATAKGTGGSGKYTYKWNTGESGDAASKLAAGSHSVTVTDENGCTASASFDITEDILPLSVSIESTSEIKCVGESSAALKADVSGGKPPFKYQWSNNSTGETVNGLAAGDYQLNITDAAGTSASAKFTVKEPTALSASIEIRAPASTNNSDGKALVKATGGKGKYSYRWKNGEGEAMATKLNAGTHSVVVTDGNGCTVTAEVDMKENILAMNVSIKQTQEVKCSGGKTAAMEVSVAGGKPPYKYQWSNGAASGEKSNNLSAGVYELTLTDAAGNSQTKSIEIKEPAALAVEIGRNTPASREDAKDGKATLKITGGSPQYSYKWDTGETEDRARKLVIGKHSVTVTDAKGCSASTNFETLQRLLPELQAGRLSSGQILQVSRIAFDADSTDVLPSSYPTLNEIALFLKQNPAVTIEVGGHTNNVPPPEFCDNLSTHRAKSVADYIANKGIAPDRVVYKGYGKRKPKYSNNHKEGRAKNQRVEIKILSLQ